MDDKNKNPIRKHIVLVHGSCHGAWSWYKVATALRRAGHEVSAPDLSASGIDRRHIGEVTTLSDYSQPVLDIIALIPPEEKVVLVGHSFGGLTMALAMDRFPQKIAVAVFVTAVMPDSVSTPFYVLDKGLKDLSLMDTKFEYNDGPEKPFTSFLFGPEFISSKLYQLCSPEDLTLATTLVRASSYFQAELSRSHPFSKEGYGSVDRVYIICGQDAAIPLSFQWWMIENNPVKEVKEINGADHMAMLSAPQELCHHLLTIADTYA